MTAPVAQKQIIFCGTYEQLFDLLAKIAQLPAAQPQPETSRAEYVLTVGELVAMEAGMSLLDPRTPEQKDADEFSREVTETRESDYPL